MTTHAQAGDVVPRLKKIPVSSSSPLHLESFPDFFVIGPQRTGTTWLHHHLHRHPEVFLPRGKETYFFSTIGQPASRHFKYSSLNEYLDTAMRDTPWRFFRKSLSCLLHSSAGYRPSLRGDATATYALLPGDVIDDIILINPDLKAIVMLRDPVERAWSHARKDLLGRTRRRASDVPYAEFEKFFRASGQFRLAQYSTIIETWSSRLKPGHLFVGSFADIAAQPCELLVAIHYFLGIAPGLRFTDRSRIRENINPAPADDIPPSVRDYLGLQLASASADYDRLLLELPPLKA